MIGTGFSWAASLLVVVAVRQELPVNLIGTGWLVIAAILFELGVRKQLREFRGQAYVIGSAARIAQYRLLQRRDGRSMGRFGDRGGVLLCCSVARGAHGENGSW